MSGEEGFVLNHDRPHLTVRCSETNELIISGPLASRQHARIFYTHGHFMLREQSANGTFVDCLDAEPVNVLRDKSSLSRQGEIALGELPHEADGLVIRFWCH